MGCSWRSDSRIRLHRAFAPRTCPTDRQRACFGHQTICCAGVAIAILTLLLDAPPARADEPPQLDYLSPAGGQQGTTVELEIGGYLDPWPVQVWTDCPGLKFEVVADHFQHVPSETERSPGILLYERKGIGKLIVQIAEDAPIGRHLVRIYTPYGGSTPVPFAV